MIAAPMETSHRGSTRFTSRPASASAITEPRPPGESTQPAVMAS